MDGTPLGNYPRRNRDLPPSPWQEVSEPYLTSVIKGIPEGPFKRNAQAAETARAISGWRNDETRMPSANSGFHSGFIRNTKYRKDTRERLIVNIRDSVCGYYIRTSIHANSTHTDSCTRTLLWRRVFSCRFSRRAGSSIGANTCVFAHTR
jgi:hypothetical protein